MTNHELSVKLSDHSIGNLKNAIEAVKSIINNGDSVSSTNEQLIVAIFGLENIGEITKIANGDNELLEKYNKELTKKELEIFIEGIFKHFKINNWDKSLRDIHFDNVGFLSLYDQTLVVFDY